MKNKFKLTFSFIIIGAMLCACSGNSNNNTESENTSQAEISTSETASESKESAFIKDGIMYIREGDGSCYTYNEGIYTDDATNESYIYGSSYFDLHAVDPDADIFKSVDPDDLSEVGNMDDENTEGKGVRIELSKMKTDPATGRYYFEEDWVGQKSYYPENGIWGTNGEFYVFSKSGTRITFSSLEEITE